MLSAARVHHGRMWMVCSRHVHPPGFFAVGTLNSILHVTTVEDIIIHASIYALHLQEGEFHCHAGGVDDVRVLTVGVGQH